MKTTKKISVPASGILITSSDLVDYGKYPSSYNYSAAGKNKASYNLTVTKKVDVHYYGTYTNSKFIFDITLAFTFGSGGIYQGTQINGKGEKSTITGNLILI